MANMKDDPPKVRVKLQMTPEEQKLLRSVLAQEPRYEQLKLDDLNIDWDYQERKREQLVMQIATQLVPAWIGELRISERPDGTFWICDGVTRYLGLRKRNELGIEHYLRSVRCEIVRTEGKRQEALLFKYYNSARKQVPLANRLQAEYLAGVDAGFGKIIKECGYKLIGQSPNTLKGGHFVRQAFDLDNGESLRKALFAIKSAWNGKHRLDGTVVLGVSKLICSQPRPIDDQLRRTLARCGPDKVDDMVQRMWGGGHKVAATLHPKDRPRFIARALGQLINKNPGRGSKIELGRIDMMDEMTA